MPSSLVVKRFWRGIASQANERGCVLWLRSVGNHGYGQITNGNRKALAHRVSWQLHNGEIPAGMCVLHRCDVRACVTPHHLFLGTKTDNANDRVAKGRGSFGERHGHAKLTDDRVREIRAAYATGRYLLRELGNKYGVSVATVSLVVNRHHWRHVERELRA